MKSYRLDIASISGSCTPDRVLRYAFDLAQSRDAKHLTSATKSNGIFHSMPWWDARVAEMAQSYPEIKVDQYHIDILTASFHRCSSRSTARPRTSMARTSPTRSGPSGQGP